MNPLLLLKLIPAKAWIGLGIAIVIGLVLAYVYHLGASHKDTEWQAKWSARELELTKAHDRMLAEEIADHNAKQKAADENHVLALTKIQETNAAVQTATAARDAARTESARLRDHIATSDLATRAAIDAAGATRQCAPATAALDLRSRMLTRLDSLADRIADAATGTGGDADRQFDAASECAGWADAMRKKVNQEN